MLKFPEIEEKILEFWEQNKIFKKTLDKSSPKGVFTFYEGPPTANGRPGVHHVLARAFKDLIPRFKTMQGYLVERKAGWDTHGLPVELAVEKQLKISGKPEIEKFGIKEFNQKCRESVWQYQEEWERLTKRIGFWLDLEHPYVTYHKEYIESLWWIFKKINDDGFLYQGYKVVPQCPRCGTALSSHEVAQGYESVTEPSVYIKFKVTKGNEYLKKGDFILSWTTTPWTLPGNVALAVGEFKYLKVELKEEKGKASVVLAKDRLSVLEGFKHKVVSEFSGADLAGVEYEPLFPEAIPEDTEGYAKAFKVYPADFVTTQDGTGVVHTAVMYGEDDYNLGGRIGLPKFHTVDESGKFKETVKNWSGQFVKDKSVASGIIEDLKARGMLLMTLDYQHDYPFCWRCHTPLLYYAKNSWFIKMSALQKELMAENQKIDWIPEHIKDGRFGEWLAQVKDWAVSRERYWGTPLPIWICQACKQKKVIGSFEELSRLSGKKLDNDFDPHRPFIDEYTLACSCGGTMKRILEVADGWFDSGSMPFAQHHYPFENKEKIESQNYYPADYIAEAIDQTRGWFYTLLAIGVLAGRGTSYKHVICLGHINDAKGQKMSKHIGNIVDPWSVINQWGADALRFHLYTINQPGESKNFDLKNVELVVKKNFLVLFNVLSFYQMYRTEDSVPAAPSQNVMDRWIMAKTDQLVKKVTVNLEQYDIFSSGRLIGDFINELSTWYLRRSRDRFKDEDEAAKMEAVQTLGAVLNILAKVMAPFTPFVAEELYQKLGGEKESVHLEAWPEAADLAEGELKLLEDMEKLRQVVEMALAKRDEAKIKIRQPLKSVKIQGAQFEGSLAGIIKQEINVKEVEFSESQELAVVLDTQLSQELIEEGLYRELVRTVNQLRKDANLTIKDRITVIYQSDSTLIGQVIDEYRTDLLKATLSKEILSEQLPNPLIDWEAEINGEKIWLALIK